MRKLAVVVALLLSGCTSWAGSAEVRLHNGTVISCPVGLKLNTRGIECGQKRGVDPISIPWNSIESFKAWNGTGGN